MTPALSEVVVAAVAIATGWLAWPGVEYLIHGVLSHRYRTLVGPFHWSHHRDPRGVFTSPYAWVPLAGLIWAAAALVVGKVTAAFFLAGLFAGFARYEWFHWRIHFREPRTEHERTMRAHHLAHHFCNPRMYHGVTTRWFDRLCGTFPDTWPADYARVESRPPLTGDSNLRAVYSPSGLRRAWTQLRSGAKS
jgi:hypothetical protein